MASLFPSVFSSPEKSYLSQRSFFIFPFTVEKYFEEANQKYEKKLKVTNLDSQVSIRLILWLNNILSRKKISYNIDIEVLSS